MHQVGPRTNLLGDDPFAKLTGSPSNEEVIVATETSVALHAAPSTTPSADLSEVDRVVVAPQRKTLKVAWTDQAARTNEFSWLAANGKLKFSH